MIWAAFLLCVSALFSSLETLSQREKPRSRGGRLSLCQLDLWSGKCVCDESGHPVGNRRAPDVKSD